MTSEPTRTSNQSTVWNFLGEAAGGCGGALNSLFVVLGDKCGLYATGQYSSDWEQPVLRSQSPGVAKKRNSSEAADGGVHADGSAIPGNDRAMTVQRQEIAFMTLICHDCAAATDSHQANSVKSVKAAVSHVLVVDDDSSIRNLLAEELRYLGYSVTIARNGSEALEHLDVMTPDVIVLDLMMPVMDGWTFVERYQDRAGHRSVPIIAVSAAGDLSSGYEARGVRAFLRKPFDLNELANCIAQLTRGREASVASLPPGTATITT